MSTYASFPSTNISADETCVVHHSLKKCKIKQYRNLQQVFCVTHAIQKTCFQTKDGIMTYRSQYSDRRFLQLNE
jgi:hypothetical protein